MDEPTAPHRNGREDMLGAAEALAQRLAPALAPLAHLAYNYRWSWAAGGTELFASIDAERFELCFENPVRLLQESPEAVLRRAGEDEGLVHRAQALWSLVQADIDRQFAAGPVNQDHPVLFLCAEYGIHRSLPVYSGGLGALAGDLLKEASDRAIPLVAVGLMYRKGYFRQRIDAEGWQHEYWIDTDPPRVPAALVTGTDGRPLTIRVPIGAADVTAQIWRVDVGRVPLFLLDSDIPDNGPLERWITGRLYESDEETRLAQYVLLGVGGVRAARAMGYEPGVIHLNEGHAALAPLELARAWSNGGRTLETALEKARSRTVFTTHTPVPAGNDTYPAAQAQATLSRFAGEIGASTEQLIALGRDKPRDTSQPFGVTQAALRMSRAANAVSRRHGEVARDMWRSLWPRRSVAKVPIGYVTNGAHVPTWIGAPMRELLTRHLGEHWLAHAADPHTWAGVDQIADQDLWAARARQRADLVSFIRERSIADRLMRSEKRDYVEAAARAFDPDVLTIGFARRVATYKRLDLLMEDPEWTLALLGGDRPVQVVLAGKAHPRDDEAKRALKRLFGLKSARIVGSRVVFLDDYDLSSAAWLVRGCDVWLNLPRPPLEASGTSGMKSMLNGGLQLSVLDGWWAEAYDGHNGWALPGEVKKNHAVQDARDATRLHSLLDDEVLPAFYDDRDGDLPRGWTALIKTSLRTLGPAFCASRMLAEYVDSRYRS